MREFAKLSQNYDKTDRDKYKLKRIELLSEAVDYTYVNKMGNLWKRNTNTSPSYYYLEILLIFDSLHSKGLLWNWCWYTEDMLRANINLQGRGLVASFGMKCQSVIYTNKYLPCKLIHVNPMFSFISISSFFLNLFFSSIKEFHFIPSD